MKITIAITLLFCSVYSMAMTEEELMKILSSSQVEHNKQKQNIRNDQMHVVIPHHNPVVTNPDDIGAVKNKRPELPPSADVQKPETQTTNSKPDLPPRATTKNVAAQESGRKSSGMTGQKRVESGCVGMPPSWCNTQATTINSKTTDDSKFTVTFGIRRGSSFNGRISRTVSNADFGLIEVEVTSNVEGDIRTLRKGTTLFCDKGYNDGTRRLDIVCNSGITPDGYEFNGIKVSVRDVNMQNGLTGVIRADKAIADRAASAGIDVALKGAAAAIGGDSLLGNSLSATAGSAADQSSSVMKEKVGTMNNVIIVNPVDLILFAGETF